MAVMASAGNAGISGSQEPGASPGSPMSVAGVPSPGPFPRPCLGTRAGSWISSGAAGNQTGVTEGSGVPAGNLTF